MALPKIEIIGTKQIPPKHWSAARLIGSTPFFASSYDQRASYCMYIPEAHYRLAATATVKPKLPLIVNVHGSMRRAERCRDLLIDLADRLGTAVLAPLFPAAVGDDPNESHGYKFLRHGDIRYDLVLLSMIDEDVAQRWPWIETEKFHLLGFSGGGQFVSRFFYLHPQRLASVSIGGPGTVTSLDYAQEWPRGLKGIESHFDGLSVDAAKLKVVPYVQLVVGEKDVESSGGGFLRWRAECGETRDEGTVTQNYKAAAKSVLARTEAMARLKSELVTVEVNVQYDVVPGAGHEAMKVFPTVLEFLQRSLSGS